MLPQVLWTKYFMDEQDIKANLIIHQDNISAEQLEINGRLLSGKQTKHMNVGYFFIKDRVNAGDFTIEHCPTKDI